MALLPLAVTDPGFVDVLAAFVALNTLIYGALALGKLMPKVQRPRLLRRRYRRSETRSIHPVLGWHRPIPPSRPRLGARLVMVPNRSRRTGGGRR
jgi:hypothetical protein